MRPALNLEELTALMLFVNGQKPNEYERRKLYFAARLLVHRAKAMEEHAIDMEKQLKDLEHKVKHNLWYDHFKDLWERVKHAEERADKMDGAIKSAIASKSLPYLAFRELSQAVGLWRDGPDKKPDTSTEV